MAKKLSVKLNKNEDGTFSRDSWYGWGPFASKFNDDGSVSFKGPDGEPQVGVEKTNDYGKYYQVTVNGGTAFLSMNEYQGTPYMRLGLGDKVAIPDEVKAKLSGPPKGTKSGAKAKPTAGAIW